MSTRTEQSLSSKVRNCFVRPQSSPSISLAPGLHHNQSILCTFMTRAVGKHKISIREPVMSTGKVKINKYWMSKKSWILEIYISYILDKSKVMNTGKVICHEYWKSHSARALEKSYVMNTVRSYKNSKIHEFGVLEHELWCCELKEKCCTTWPHKHLLFFILLTIKYLLFISRMKVKVKVSRAIKRGRTIWLTYLMSFLFLSLSPTSLLPSFASTLYPSYQQQWITHYQTLFIMSKCV